MAGGYHDRNAPIEFVTIPYHGWCLSSMMIPLDGFMAPSCTHIHHHPIEPLGNDHSSLLVGYGLRVYQQLPKPQRTNSSQDSDQLINHPFMEKIHIGTPNFVLETAGFPRRSQSTWGISSHSSTSMPCQALVGSSKLWWTVLTILGIGKEGARETQRVVGPWRRYTGGTADQ